MLPLLLGPCPVSASSQPGPPSTKTPQWYKAKCRDSLSRLPACSPTKPPHLQSRQAAGTGPQRLLGGQGCRPVDPDPLPGLPLWTQKLPWTTDQPLCAHPHTPRQAGLVPAAGALQSGVRSHGHLQPAPVGHLLLVPCLPCSQWRPAAGAAGVPLSNVAAPVLAAAAAAGCPPLQQPWPLPWQLATFLPAGRPGPDSSAAGGSGCKTAVTPGLW
mmetsp:Transcript_22581/g.62372  ORF Transcript_22581/g.62372 Transcript_22581/m.62372 type:complete len:214 (-) Transcript_22581:1049-1690(-)